MRFGYTIFFVFVLRLLPAQTPYYIHYTVQDGLPGNLVYCGLQDRRGLLWFGTDKGLACFDGMRFRVYGVEEGLPDPEVLSIEEDSDGRLWLFCFRKKPCYLLNGQIITEKQDSLLAQLDFTSGTYIMKEGSNGRKWFAGYDRKAYCIEKGETFSLLVPDGVNQVWENQETILALGSRSISQIIFGKKPKKLYTLNHDLTKEPFFGIAISGSRVLYAYNGRLILLEWKHNNFTEIDRLPVTKSNVCTDAQGRFWLCTSSSGAVCFDNKQQDLTHPVTYLPDEKINYMFEDKQGTLWFCSYDEGLFALPKNAPLRYNTGSKVSSQNIRSLARMSDGQILFGNDIGQVNSLKNGQISTINFSSKKEIYLIRQLISLPNATFWAATDRGLIQYNLDKHQIVEQSNPGLSIKSIVLTADSIWAATHGSLLCYSIARKKSRQWVTGRTTAVGSDSDGNIWLGNINGFFSKKDSFQTNWGDKFPKLKSRIVNIKNAGNNQLWVATPQFGLLKVTTDNGSITKVDQLNAHFKNPIMNIQSLFLEPNGRIWMAANTGVYGMDTSGTVLHFSSKNGLAGDDANAVLVHNDTLWVGTVSGLSCIDLKAVRQTGEFQSMLVALQYQQKKQSTILQLLDSLPGSRQILLPPDVSNIRLDMSGLDFRSYKNLEFEIVQSELLLPLKWWTFDNLLHWITRDLQSLSDTFQVQTSSFGLGASLPAGKYQIQVTAINASGVHSLFPDNWTIIKRPFWYESLWFYLLIWLSLMYLAWRVYRARVAYRELTTTASSLTLQALQSQMNPHFIGNAINAIQQFLYPPNPEKASEYIAIFMRLLRRTMHFSEKTLIPFEDELNYIQEYLQLVQLRFEDRFKYEVLGAEHIPPGTPIPSMLIQPVLENATLHGIAPEGNSNLRLEFKIAQDYLHCTLTDNGIGYNATIQRKKQAGIVSDSKGLSLLHKKINTLNRLYDLDMQLNVQDLSEIKPTDTGTRVTLHYSLSKIWKVKKDLLPTAPNKA